MEVGHYLYAMTDPSHMSLPECAAKLTECLELATRANSEAERTMLLHMAETWQRICEDLENSKLH